MRPIRQKELAELTDVLHAGVTIQIDPKDERRIRAHVMGLATTCSEVTIRGTALSWSIVRTA